LYCTQFLRGWSNSPPVVVGPALGDGLGLAVGLGEADPLGVGLAVPVGAGAAPSHDVPRATVCGVALVS